ncbi:CAMPATH-1 antigen [Rousettus aegyptiacus]|uniref:CAMPATH-1 antigen n=1 Tax=Rousettus aegyptiacus TaxID=9407 RepID=A0A7J8K652_ROUAE|nr:CAMPATH-1 antigen [Rousettus aegyptiacus]KAF6504301.1 CD52 molecule [Rousettus aegyptiacus]
MKGFLFLLSTISLLVMIQIQTGVLGQGTMRSTTAPPHSDKGGSSAAPALSSLGSGSVLLFLTSTLIQLFYLS